jgi:hypothetical protein
VPSLDDHGALGIGRARTVLFNKAYPGFVKQLGLPLFCIRHPDTLPDGVRPGKRPQATAGGDRTRNVALSGYDRPGDIGSTLGPQIPT